MTVIVELNAENVENPIHPIQIHFQFGPNGRPDLPRKVQSSSNACRDPLWHLLPHPQLLLLLLLLHQLVRQHGQRFAN